MGKIKFKKYDVAYGKHTYCILIPHDVEKLWVYNFGGEEGTGWIGNRKTIQTLMYAAAVLGFNPTDKVIYFPIRKNKVPESYTWADKCDLIFTTHQVQLKRSDWTKIRNTLRYKRAGTYYLDYDEKRTVAYFESSIAKWKNTVARWKKEYLIEVMQDDTLFQVFSRKQFQQIYLELHSFLQKNLENEFADFLKKDSFCVPYTYMGLERPLFWWRGKKQMWSLPFIDFYDEKIERRIKKDRVRKIQCH